ncbi:MAG: hypothetical protein M3461_05940 [Pseudomonadota bacterium]|nr:hypothetical protein [Pseudomonadota bacterium]
MQPLITGNGQPVSPAGVITNLQGFPHPQLGGAFGPADIVSVLAWDVDPNAARAEITSSLGGEPAVVEADPADTPIRCQSKACDVLIVCISADTVEPCNNRINVSVRRPRCSNATEGSRQRSDGTSGNAAGINQLASRVANIPFAAGVANVPFGQTQNVKLRLTTRGRRIARSGVKRLRGTMEIKNVAGFPTVRIPIRIRIK